LNGLLEAGLKHKLRGGIPSRRRFHYSQHSTCAELASLKGEVPHISGRCIVILLVFYIPVREKIERGLGLNLVNEHMVVFTKCEDGASFV
jgi:hypothetical protein